LLMSRERLGVGRSELRERRRVAMHIWCFCV
jgi:hypothetical protein